MDKYQKASAIVAIVGVILFTVLLISNKIGSGIYLSLITLLSFTSLCLFFGDKIKAIYFNKNKKIIMDIEKSKQEIFASEKYVRDIALALSETIAFILDSQSISHFESTIITNRLNSLKEKIKVWDKHFTVNEKVIACKRKLNNFLDILKASQEEKEKVFSPFEIQEFNQDRDQV